MSNEAFSKGNAAFVEENYEEALDWYSKAIDLDNENADYFIKRAQAHIKCDNYGEALKDSEKAIALDAKNSKAYLRKGIAEFHLEHFAEAKKAFQSGQEIDGSERQFPIWIRKCDAEISLAEQNPSTAGTQVGVAVGSETDVKNKTADKKEETKPTETKTETKPPPEPTKSAQPVEIPMPTGPQTRYDWYQTETHVILSILVKKVKQEECKVDIQEKSLSVTLKLPSGSDYSLEVDLLHPIVPGKSITKVLGSKVEIKLKKADGIRWMKLEGDGTQANVKQVSTGTPDAGEINKYPSSSHYTKDWDKLVADIKQEEKEEKPEGDAALNSLFQKIYADGSDEVKKAMNKSFSESGGTVLSTNWKDIGKEKVDIKPPDGMEWKKYD